MISFFQKSLFIIIVIFTFLSTQTYAVTQQEYNNLADDFETLNDEYTSLEDDYFELLEYSEDLELQNDELLYENEELELKLFESEEFYEEKIEKMSNRYISLFSFIISILMFAFFYLYDRYK